MRCGFLRVPKVKGDSENDDGEGRDGLATQHVYNLSAGGEEGAAADAGYGFAAERGVEGRALLNHLAGVGWPA
jgi:hypothetical protein